MAKQGTPEERIEQWKKKHGRVFLMEVNDLQFYFRKPDMRTMAAVTKLGANDPMQATIVFFSNTLLNKEMMEYKEDVDVMSAIAPQLEKLVENYTVKVKEL